jgi:hypothetical protein
VSDLSTARVLAALARRDALQVLHDRYVRALAHDARTAQGRERHGLHEAIRALGGNAELVERGDAFDWSTYGSEYIGAGAGEVDLVHLLVETTPDDAGVPDPMPVRIVVEDGGETSHASAWLSIDTAREVWHLLGQAIDRAEKSAHAHRIADAYVASDEDQPPAAGQ